MKLQQRSSAIRATFDDPNLVSCAGPVPVMRLAESVGLHGVVAQRVHLPGDVGSNPAGKVTTIVAGMAAGRTRSMIWTWYASARGRTG